MVCKCENNLRLALSVVWNVMSIISGRQKKYRKTSLIFHKNRAILKFAEKVNEKIIKNVRFVREQTDAKWSRSWTDLKGIP